MESQEIYLLYLQHDRNSKGWYDYHSAAILDELKRDGYITPRCLALSYSVTKDAYKTTTVQIDPADLLNEDLKKHHHGTLQTIDKAVPGTLLAIMFIAEGKVPVKDSSDTVNFLLVTYETKLFGWKRLFTFDKTTKIDTTGKAKMQAFNIVFQEELSKQHNMAEAELFSHILRKNYYNKHEDCYN